MFENLSDRLQKVVKNIKGYGKITDENIGDILREVRLVLLEADVDYIVVKEFTNKVKEKALGVEVQTSLKPSEVFLNILKEELLELLGENDSKLVNNNFNIVMLIGLQGSGKTTTVGKLGKLVRKKYNKKPMVRVRIKGDLEEGYFSKDLDLKKIELEFPELYLSFSNKIDEKRLKESLEKLKELQTKKANVEGISREIFFEQLKQTQFSNSFDSQRLFELLYNKDLEKAKDIILDKDSKI